MPDSSDSSGVFHHPVSAAPPAPVDLSEVEAGMIRLIDGESLGVTQAEYDAKRRPAIREGHAAGGFRSLCHAPSTSLMFNQDGRVYVCNHAHGNFAMVDESFSILECWRSDPLRRIREQFAAYRLDAKMCRHCVRQLRSRQIEQSFPLVQFDRITPTSTEPDYPKHLIFYLGNACNLACIMCNGTLSSRHRKEFEKRPPIRSPYGERFFRELEEILPQAEYLEFYGGEPFLVREHMRIFEILEKTGARVPLFVNTNATAFHARAKHFLETLNFVTVAVSMDAVNPALHTEIRYGLDSEVFMDNVDYLMRLREARAERKDGRPPLHLMLNVTEHRKNWFDLPEVFRFAEKRRIFLHVNTCVHPDHITLYMLPTPELTYVLDFFVGQRAQLLAEFPGFSNLGTYDFMIGLTRAELDRRRAGQAAEPPERTAPIPEVPRRVDGMLGHPMAGYAPFDTPEKLLAEVGRMASLGEATRRYFGSCIGEDLARMDDAPAWEGVRHALGELC